MKTYIFNTNFLGRFEDRDKLILKQKQYMQQCEGQIAISSTKSLYNYNDEYQYQNPHIKSLCYGLYVEDVKGNVKIDKHFPKTKALFIATMWAEKDIYIVAKNGFYNNGKYFTSFLEHESEAYFLDLYSLQSVYLIYLKGDVRTSVFLEAFYVIYDKEHDLSIVSYGKLEPHNILNIIKGYTYAYSDSKTDINLLNGVNQGYAIGDQFNLSQLGKKVEHVNNYYFINKYIELYVQGEK